MKRALSICLTALMLLLLCACGGQKSEPPAAEQEPLSWQEQYDLGIRYLSEGNYEEAIIAFTAAIEIDAKRAEAYIGRGHAYIGTGETDESLATALADYEKAIELDAANADAYLGLADVYIRQGNYEKALELLKASLSKTGENEKIAVKIKELESGNVTDSSGKVRKTSGYDAAGTLVWYHLYTYRNDGKRASVTAFDASGAQLGHVDMDYDAAGHQTRTFSYSPDTGTISMLEHTYHEDGTRSSSTHYHEDGTVRVTTEYVYENGLVVQETDYSPDGQMEGMWKYEYDQNQQRTKRAYHNPDGSLQYYQTWEYDDDGRQTVYCSYGADGALQWKHIDRYGEDGSYLGYEEYNGEGELIGAVLNEQ